MFIDIKLAPHGSTIPSSDWNSTSGSWWGTTSSTLRWSSRSSSFLCLVSKVSKTTRVSISTYLVSRLSDALNFSRLVEQGPYHEPRRDAAPRSPRCQM